MESLENGFALLIKRIDALEERVGALEERVGALDNRVETVETKVDSLDGKFTSMHLRIDALRIEMREQMVQTRSDLDHRYSVGVAEILNNFEELMRDRDDRLEVVEEKLGIGA